MIYGLIALLVIIVEVALAAYVSAQAWEYRHTRLFVAFTTVIVTTQSLSIVRDLAPSADAAFLPLALLVACIGLYFWVLMLLLSALFIPEWWERRTPIIWISVPYLAATLLILLDGLGRFGFIFTRVFFEQVYRFDYNDSVANVLAGFSLIGQLFPFVVLRVALTRPEHREVRPLIWALIVSIAVSVVLGIITGQFLSLVRVAALLQTLPILVTFGFAIVTNQLLVSRRIGLDLALQSLDEAVAVVDKRGVVRFANPRSGEIGLREGVSLAADLSPISESERAVQALYQAAVPEQGPRRATMTLSDRIFSMLIAPINDQRQHHQGTLILGRDITMLTKRTQEIERERVQLREALSRIETEQRQREQLAATVRALTIPIIPVLPGVLVMPLIGDLDTERIDDFQTILLDGIEQQRADTVMLDITGITLLDTQSARGLIDGVRAATLLGANCVLVGVRPEIAQSLVSLGVDLEEVQTAPSLEQAVLERLRRVNRQVVPGRA